MFFSNNYYLILIICLHRCIFFYSSLIILQATLNILDAGMQEALQDVYCKTLKKILTQTMPVPEEIDDSLLL